MRLSEDRHLVFFHRFKESRLCFGSRTVDFISQDNIGKHRSLLEFEVPYTRPVCEDLCSDDVRRHEVWGELDPLETQAQRLAQRLHHQGFAQSWDALDQDMTTGKKGG